MLKLIKLTVILLLLVSANFAQSPLSILFDDGVSYLPQTVSYVNRVTADGGTIIDIEAIDAAYTDAIDNGYYDSLYFFGDANFGIKKDANNKVTKLYNLFGTNDASQTDTSKSPAWYADSLNGKATLKFNSDFLTTDINPDMRYGFSAYNVLSNHLSIGVSAMMGADVDVSFYRRMIYNGNTIITELGGDAATTALVGGTIGSLYSKNIVGFSIDPSDGNRAKHYANGSVVANAQLSSPISLIWASKKVVFGVAQGDNLANPFIGNISSFILSRDVITEPSFLNAYYSIY